MKFEYCKTDLKYCAFDLQLKSDAGKSLSWNCEGGALAVIVKTPFSKQEVTYVEHIRKIIEGMPELSLNPVKIAEGIELFFVKPAQANGFPIADVAATYRIFPYRYLARENCFRLYEPLDQAMSKSYVDVAQDAKVHVWKHVVTRRSWFKVTTEETGFYCFQCANALEGYRDGDLYYMANGLKIPITRKMVEPQTISYIEANEPPTIQSGNDGIHVKAKD